MRRIKRVGQHLTDSSYEIFKTFSQELSELQEK